MRIECHLFETAERIAVEEGGIVGSGTALDTLKRLAHVSQKVKPD